MINIGICSSRPNTFFVIKVERGDASINFGGTEYVNQAVSLEAFFMDKYGSNLLDNV